jgi:4-hydroxyphenylpyruvate dioxygenase-like putative hemolysin
MQKFLFELLQRKEQLHGDGAAKALHADIESIEQDKHTWHDISPEELEYVRSILGGVG